ncbi:MAG: glutamate racemase [Candidatus Moranbacteria bacterium RIFOXYA12_FULL_35_19]|nr:MAG: Glutamate racemase [Candidatus Moranbacteria bacterium GW2011_GWF2_35_39]OGI30653.1 MAG: glutamate racemase [Candidatus Moranbacteria bacterium RIFOXYB12_FULL_35_8]OGI33245.1 MAG: glutamate racemase [Candidatus Moranbacteria bacterium RIFOXYC12_FULL_36_13]OGI36510.1 MAG: glutamate racemase [Candidatus Moranbacteria bacterium RIFOXYA12_FULL_35_19]
MTKNKSIGIFDSGFGGLDIMKGIVKELPNYNFIYLGDTARVPYGVRSEKVLYKFTKQAVDFLFKKKCEIIIFACNTVSSNALRKIQKKYIPKYYPGKKALGVIIPAVELAVQKTKNKKVGVIATLRTVESKSFLREFSKIDNNIKIFQKDCPLLVPIIEAGEIKTEKINEVLENYLKPLIDKKIDTLILGCTHYGILKNKIKKIIGNNIKIIVESDIVAKKLKDYLRRHQEIEKKIGREKKRIFYSTGLVKKFEILGKHFYGEKIKVQKIKLSKNL